jgi:hypothetical protein
LFEADEERNHASSRPFVPSIIRVLVLRFILVRRLNFAMADNGHFFCVVFVLSPVCFGQFYPFRLGLYLLGRHKATGLD